MVRPNKRVRLADLAEYCGVSMSTASRALSGTPGVRPELREKILAATKTLNYHQPTSIAGLKVVVAASAAAMVDYQRNQFTTFVLEGIRTRAETLGVEIVTKSISNLTDEREVLDEALADDDVAGLLFVTIDDEEMLAPTREFSKPVLLVNGDDPFMGLSSVAPNNRAAASVATAYLRSLGHEKILFIAHRGRRTIERRLEGWRGLQYPNYEPEWRDYFVNVDDWTPEAAKEAIRNRLKERGLDYTAILAGGDSLAIGAIMGLKEEGINVPEDVSVLGIDGLPQGEFTDPPLTSVQIPMKEIGAVSIDLLREHALTENLLSRRVELSCTLITRGSTGPVKKT